MPITEFCSKLKELYGQERMFLFPGENVVKILKSDPKIG